ncbi:MAG TPA: hypothetical protein VGK31_15130 [Thermoanaerobaculia bacterium]|jgi:hypothetical protein
MKDLDALIAEMYDSICFEKGQRPDWHRNDEIYAPGARLVRINDAGVFEFDLQSYRKNFEEMIDSGEMPSFWEGELWRETRQFGDMAHVLSAYETRRSREGELLNRGVNSIQAFQRDGRWWISAMIWRREGRDVALECGVLAPPSEGGGKPPHSKAGDNS